MFLHVDTFLCRYISFEWFDSNPCKLVSLSPKIYEIELICFSLGDLSTSLPFLKDCAKSKGITKEADKPRVL